MYLKTETHTLTIPAIRRVIRETISWASENVGTKRKRLPLTFKVKTNPLKGCSVYGIYDPTTNVIWIDPVQCHNVKLIIRTVLHEYCHFLQDIRSYKKLLREVGYNNHPQELEARVMETMYSVCWKDIKNNL